MQVSRVTAICVLAVFTPLVRGMPTAEEEAEELLELLKKTLMEVEGVSDSEVTVGKRGGPIDQIVGPEVRLSRTPDDAKLCSESGQEANCRVLEYRITYRKESAPEYMAMTEEAVWGSDGRVRLPLTSRGTYDVTVCRMQIDGKLQPCEKIIHNI